MTEQFSLRLHAAEEIAPETQPSPAGWSRRSYLLAGAARDATQPSRTVELPAGAVLEIELANGQRLLVAAEDAERYLGRARVEGGGRVYQVGGSLQPTGPSLPAVSRDGLGAWVLKALHVYDSGPAGMTALALAGSFEDAQLDQHRGLYRLALDDWKPTLAPALPATPRPILLFLHGTASSCEGSFRGLWGGKGSEMDARAALREAYDDRVYGFEHRSLTASPIENALDLVALLPEGACLHLVSHSRGGMVGELLARANRVDIEPFGDAEIVAFVEQAQGRARDEPGKQAAAAEGARLRALSQALRRKAIRVERFVRVAAPVRGTTLASGRLDRWASVMLNLIGGALDLVGGVPAVARAYELGKNFLLKVVAERTDARLLPGLEAMMPDSPLVALLNGDEATVRYPVHVLAGDYDAKGILSWIANWLAEAFYGGQTDLVVNTPSMSGGAARQEGIWYKPLAGPQVCHFTYFTRRESGNALLAALRGDNAPFARLAEPSRARIARGGIHVKPLADGPIALMLPGIMGSHLKAGDEWVWFFPPGILAGQMERLRVEAGDVTPAGWIDMKYEGFARHLAQSHEVRPFAYDWRLSMRAAAQRFGKELDQALADAERRGKPLRIVAHSMGGLVARLALKDRWARFKAIPGSRLVQFGTPNMGSHSIAAVLTGRDPFVQMIERLDWSHDMNAFLGIASRFPGVLELLPWPGANGRAADGNDYFDPDWWVGLRDSDTENRPRARADWETARGAGDGWPSPLPADLVQACATVADLMAAPVDPACTLYVAGQAPTPIALRANDGKLEMRWTDAGDGRVPWAGGIPAGVRAWRVDAAHGDLLDQEAVFDEYTRLIAQGNCSGLPRVTPEASLAPPGSFVPATRAGIALYPTGDELLAAAMGGRAPGSARPAPARPPAIVEVWHDGLAGASSPVLIGAYAHDPLRGSAAFLDDMLRGELGRAKTIGRYPNQPGDVALFRHPDPDGQPRGAVVVGLGPIGELHPGTLTRALTDGLIEYARWHAAGQFGAAAGQAEIACLLVGTGFGGVSVAMGLRALLDALCQANERLAAAGFAQGIGKLRILEYEESRVIAAATVLRRLVGNRRYVDAIRYDGGIAVGQCHFRGHSGEADDGWQRVHIVKGGNVGGLRFTLVSGRARNAVDEEPDQQQAVSGLMKSATASTADQPGLSRALFELMVPNGFKEALPDLRGVILAVDPTAAVFPWELMRDEAAPAEPLATRVGLIRQLATPYGNRCVTRAETGRVLVVGDTQSGSPLPGARREGEAVARLFRAAAHEVVDLYEADGQSVFVNLFDGGYRFVHIAAHGTVAEEDAPGQDGGKTYTGVVLGQDTYLTAAQVGKLRQVPEAVFLNCCHLGSMAEDAHPRWGELAAGLATEFIELGCKAVIAAGWAVEDEAAETFATTFWGAMLRGEAFGDAVREARAAAYEGHPASNTWGAYQAYGDERYRLIKLEDDWHPPASYIHLGQALVDLDRNRAFVSTARPSEMDGHRRRAEAMEDALRASFFESGAVRERLGDIRRALGDGALAIEHYRAALVLEDGGASLHALEQLANLEIREGGDLLARDGAAGRGEALMDDGLARIEALLALGATAERLGLKASAWKRIADARLLLKRPAKDRLAAVRTMTETYLAAVAASRRRAGEADYAPLLNAADGAVLLAAHGQDTLLKQLEQDYPDWAADARANAARRLAIEGGFFPRAAEIDGRRAAALRACLGEPGRAAPLTDADVLRDLLAAYRGLLAGPGHAGEKDAVLAHLDWLARQWPRQERHGDAQAALRRLRDDLAPGK